MQRPCIDCQTSAVHHQTGTDRRPPTACLDFPDQNSRNLVPSGSPCGVGQTPRLLFRLCLQEGGRSFGSETQPPNKNLDPKFGGGKIKFE